MAFTVAELEGFRAIQDPVADLFISDLIRDHNLDVINQLLPILTRNYELTRNLFPDTIGQRVEQYLDENGQLPVWANLQSIKIAQDLFATNSVIISMLLNFRSLPMTYACAHGAHVLYETGLMTARDGQPNLVRRLMETAQFVIFCMEPGGLAPGGRGIVTAQKIRLIHACIRYYLNQNGWDQTAYGAPINQEDTAGTLLAFSALVIEGLELSGYTITLEQKDAYIHCWNVISYWIGLDSRLRAPDYASALELGYQIFAHQQATSPAGLMLTSALVTEVQNQLGGLFKDTVPILIRYYCQDKIGDLLGITAESLAAEHELAERIKILGADIQHLEEKHAFLRWMLDRMSLDFLEIMKSMFNHYKKVEFYLPAYLTEGASEFDTQNQRQ